MCEKCDLGVTQILSNEMEPIEAARILEERASYIVGIFRGFIRTKALVTLLTGLPGQSKEELEACGRMLDAAEDHLRGTLLACAQVRAKFNLPQSEPKREVATTH